MSLFSSLFTNANCVQGQGDGAQDFNDSAPALCEPGLQTGVTELLSTESHPPRPDTAFSLRSGEDGWGGLACLTPPPHALTSIKM